MLSLFNTPTAHTAKKIARFLVTSAQIATAVKKKAIGSVNM